MTAAIQIRRAAHDDWRVVKRVRLAALQEAPYAFGSTYERDAATGFEPTGKHLPLHSAPHRQISEFAGPPRQSATRNQDGLTSGSGR